MKKFTKIYTIVPLVILVFNVFFQLPVLAAADNLLWGGMQSNIEDELELGNEDPRVMAAMIINVLLGFLGIIAVLIIIWAGFKWMTAGGNESGIEDAKKMMAAGVIGLLIILASWALATFVVDTLYNATTT